MRLTLRTLLAYLDDILDPVDKEELSKKVESSEFAEELIHRTRDTMRRLRLSAPQVVGTGMGLDPNTVAEYLDNVLPPDSVGDFERICLESDMHLAEVASCHHVLTMVLGEPAEIDPLARERMYTIPGESGNQRRFRVEPATTAAPAAMPPAPAANGVAATPVAPTPDPLNQSIFMEVPDYLRASGWTATRTAMVAIAALLLVAAAVMLLPGLRERFSGTNTDLAAGRQSGPTPPLLDMKSDNSGTATQDVVAPMSAATGVAPETIMPTVPAAQPIVSPQSDVGATMPMPLQGSALPPAQGAIPANTVGPGIAANDNAGAANMTNPPTSATPIEPGGPLSGNIAGARPWPTAPGTNVAASGLPATPPPATSVPTSPSSANLAMSQQAPGTNTTAAMPPANVTGMPDVANTNAAPQASAVGVYQGDRSVLLRFNETLGNWFRIEPQASVFLGDKLLALPEFRPRISLAAGVQMDISGGSLVVMRTADAVTAEGLPPGAATTPAIELLYGRIVLLNSAPSEQTIRLTTGPNTADVRLSPNSPLGVQVAREFVPGVDPRKVPAPVRTTVVAPVGGFAWVDRSGERVVTDPGQWLIAENTGVQPGPLPQPLPEWLEREPTTQRSEQLAAPDVERALVTNRPADDQLLELYEGSRRRELKSLATRASIHAGMFVPFVAALRDSEQRANWRSQIDNLRAAMVLSPASADQVWLTLVKQRGDRAAADLYEMLCGYSPEQVGKTPEERSSPGRPLARLIGWLESDNIDYRVLAVENLFDITGKRLLQNPLAIGAPDRNPGIRDWKKRLADREL